MHRHLSLLLRSLVAIVALTLVASACGDDDGTDAGGSDGSSDSVELTMNEAWSRLPAEGQTATAVYGVVSNPGDADVRLVAASSPVTDTVELHETTMDDEGVMSMQEVEEGFVVPAGGSFTFEPGGPHIMMLDIDPATYPDTVEVTLTAEGAGDFTFTAEVREGDAMDMGDDMSEGEDHGDMSGDDMSEDEMSDGDMSEGDMSDGDMSEGDMPEGEG